MDKPTISCGHVRGRAFVAFATARECRFHSVRRHGGLGDTSSKTLRGVRLVPLTLYTSFRGKKETYNVGQCPT